MFHSRLWAVTAASFFLATALGADEGADFKYKSLTSGQFDGQILIAADFSCSVALASFDKAVLQKAKFNYAVASDTRFTRSDLQGAQLKYSVLSDAKFTGADCRAADFSY